MFYSFIKAVSSIVLENIKDGGRYSEYETESKQVACGSVACTIVESAHQVMMHSVLRMTFFPSLS